MSVSEFRLNDARKVRALAERGRERERESERAAFRRAVSAVSSFDERERERGGCVWGGRMLGKCDAGEGGRERKRGGEGGGERQGGWGCCFGCLYRRRYGWGD
jgi:hypothetical protein